MRYLVIGLESGATRIVSRMIAFNLGIIKEISDWDGYDIINDDNNLVCHKSLPHGVENNFIDFDFANTFDYVVLSTRDWNCSLISKIEKHEHNIIEAYNQHMTGISIMKDILNRHKNVYVFSPETAFLLQESYTTSFLKSLQIIKPKHVHFENTNRKYIKELGL
jgi:hypothetical protein